MAIDPDVTPLPSPPSRRKRFAQKSFSLGASAQFRGEKALAAADAIEDEELIRKLITHKDAEDCTP